MVQHAKLEVVREEELRRYLLAQEQVVKAQVQLAQAKKNFESCRDSLVDRIKTGCRFMGSLIATVEVVAGPARPKWKDIALEFAEKLGLPRSSVEAQALLQAQKQRSLKPILVIATKQ